MSHPFIDDFNSAQHNEQEGIKQVEHEGTQQESLEQEYTEQKFAELVIDKPYKKDRLSPTPRLPKVRKQDLIYKRYDDIWKQIVLPQITQYIIGHPIFQRLSKLRQLAAIKYLENFKQVPGNKANHSRFDHSIGVAYLAYKVALYLQSLYPNEITLRHVICVTLAGLCHDLGHGPYSHTYDVLIKQMGYTHPGIKHEYRSMRLFEIMMKDLIKTGAETCNLSDKEIRFVQYLIDPDLYKKYIDNNLSQLPQHKAGLEQIVNNYNHKVDVDKMDYLLRDPYHLHMEVMDKESILSLLSRSAIINDKWLFDIADRRTTERLLHHRYNLYASCYQSDESIAINCMLIDALKLYNAVNNITACSKLETAEDINDFCSLGDDAMFEDILNMSDQRLKKAQSIVKNIQTGKKLYTTNGITYATNVRINELGKKSLDNMLGTHDVKISIFDDKSSPINVLLNIEYHNNGVITNRNEPLYMRFTSGKL